MAWVDIKVTSWERMFIRDEDVNDIKQALESGEVKHPSDLYEKFEIENTEGLFDTSVYLSPEDNDGFSTIELIVDTETQWANGKH